ncbi:molecular chaperone IbpA [Bradyrhizobium japonicum]|uniref:Hsp20 family protein n=1 Tax=Bradyrhizobium TaxID=374 RepID=UPI001BAD84BA|nr:MULTISPECIES: Hsp20 family protein [Bradyrhizobium]WLC01447.1 Hsp20 family protein [Bradyrhizobium japonicum USDA 123]MBR0883831.1 Hsp20 family protein [Bradyrhizobium liaoningense]MBR1003961.1 Hsp20 family protein [Bradyrhizobium liaoningense]MBR1033368.1 Hsp20 family protein [Bradyrhizobium liaoningense]MBR1070181.1 Hsp20 family protein [Bradyrhizobium liaoningense]
MRYDWTPLWRSTIGFDHLFDVLDEVQRTAEETYPPYNIERLDENHFQISVALAGFTPDEVGLTVEQNVLTLEGHKAEKDEKTFLHRGMSTRSFKRQFTLADHVEVKGAHFENGLLVIELQREIPEAMKPRRIAIAGASAGQVKQIEGKAA